MTDPLTCFPLTRCPNCGYALQGLPPAGRCPECGTPYNTADLILFGWNPTRFQHPGATIVYILAICFALFLLVDAAIGIVTLLALVVSGHYEMLGFPLLLVLGYGGGAAALFLLARWTRRRSRRHIVNPDALGTPTLQLRLAPEGYAFRRGFGAVHYLRWLPDMEIDISREGPIAFLRIARLTPVGTTDWSTLLHMAFPATPEQAATLLTHITSLRHFPSP